MIKHPIDSKIYMHDNYIEKFNDYIIKILIVQKLMKRVKLLFESLLE